MFKVTHNNTGITETFRSKAELFAALPITDADYTELGAGKAIECSSFMGTVTVRMTGTKHMVTHYELVITENSTELRMHATGLPNGYAVIEHVATATPKATTLDGMRKHGMKTAKRMKVGFRDNTVGAK